MKGWSGCFLVDVKTSCEEPTHLEGNACQSEGLEVPPRSLSRTQDEALLPGTDVVAAVAVERAHAVQREAAITQNPAEL